VAEPRELAREEPQVHALAAALHVAAIGDERDPQRPSCGATVRAEPRFSAYRIRLFGQK
jgi:hypothetical protein